MHQRRWKWLRWNQKKRGRRHRFFSTSKSRPLLLVLCLRVCFSMLPFLVNSDMLYKGNLLPATSSLSLSLSLCCCSCCCCSQARKKRKRKKERKSVCIYIQRALFGLRFARLNPQQYRNREDVKSKEQFEIYDAELHKDDFF